MRKAWLETLRNAVGVKPIVVLRFTKQQWSQLLESRRGGVEFTAAYAHKLLDGLKVPAVCLYEGADDAGPQLRIGLLTSKEAVSTFETRVKVVRGAALAQVSLAEVVDTLRNLRLAKSLTRRVVANTTAVALLSPKLSQHVVDILALTEVNRVAMQQIAEAFSGPRTFRSMASLQENAVDTALKAFDINANNDLVTVEVVANRETALRRVWISEDNVIQHDTRVMDGFGLVGSDTTGRAIFKSGDVQVEVITANKLPLEEVFGVDLILVNLTMSNVVMIQYKMLHPLPDEDDEPDWIFRPDKQLDDEIARMRMFDADLAPDSSDYRLNPGLFYLKFIKRDAALSSSSIITPLEHFELLRRGPDSRGPRNGPRISFRSLSGRYLRETPFLDLIRAGYIGARAETTAHLKPLIASVLAGDRALVAAIKSSRTAMPRPRPSTK